MQKAKLPRLVLFRIILGILILGNMALIYSFSSENGNVSTETSKGVSQSIATVTVVDFSKKPAAEQNDIVNRINTPLRKIAHMAEFGTLGALVLLFLLTWEGHFPLRYCGALLFTLLYACIDEWHQSFSDERGPAFTDVLIDLSGAVITCTCILIILLLWRRKHAKRGELSS